VTEAGAVDTDGLTLEGCDPLIALSHLALYGMTAILQDAGYRDLRLGWTAGARSRPRLHRTGLTADDVAAAVLAHAARHIQPTSWIMADAADGKGPLFAPRAARLTPSELRERDAQRRAWLDRLQGDGDHLSQSMVAALGGPASWARDPSTGELAQNLGATPWDLQPRNNGADLVSTKIRPLARVVADRSVSTIRDGLVGAATVDELARRKGSYRTATGLAPLAPVDSAVMWCALWGISWHPLTVQGLNRSIDKSAHAHVVAAGHIATDDRGEWFYAPLWHTPRTPAAVRTTISDGRLRAAVAASLASPTGSLASTVPMSGEAYLARLAAHQPGARSVVMWPIRNHGTEHAADRRAGRGFLLPLDVTTNTATPCGRATPVANRAGLGVAGSCR
jgi:CRISPR-associated protein Csb3